MLNHAHRYCNMDYIFASAFKHQDPALPVIVSYDIACQWHKSVADRLQHLPALVRLVIPSSIFRYVIPKLHIHSHILSCQTTFSFNLTPGSGMTDGEGIERSWAMMGPVANSTKEMGPGSRQNTLEDHWGYWNWQKYISLGESSVFIMSA